MWRPTLLTLGLAGCGSTCPPPVAQDAAVTIAPSPAPQTCPDPTNDVPAPVVAMAPDQSRFAGYDGRWYFMEPGDDEVELVLEIHEGSGTIREVGHARSQPIQVRTQPNGFALVVIAGPGRRVEQGLLVPRGPHSVTAFEFGDDEALIGRREAPVPPRFEGKWLLTSLGGGDLITLEIEGGGGRIVRDGKTQNVEIRGIQREGALFDLVVRRGNSPREEDMAWLRASEVEPEVYLLFEGDEGDFVVMHRPRAEPAWVERASRKVASPPGRASSATPASRAGRSPP